MGTVGTLSADRQAQNEGADQNADRSGDDFQISLHDGSPFLKKLQFLTIIITQLF